MQPITCEDGSIRYLDAKLEMGLTVSEHFDDQLDFFDDRITNENVLEAQVDLARVHQFGPLDGGSSSSSNGGTILATADPSTPRSFRPIY